MNQLSLQVVTWGMVSSVVTAAVWLAMVGDAANSAGRERMSPAFLQANTSRQDAPKIHPALYARKAQRAVGGDVAPVSLKSPQLRGRDDS